MQLVDLESLLGIKIAEDQTAIYAARLAAAIDTAKHYCNNPFSDENGEEKLPPGAQMGIALLVQAMGEKQNVASQSLGDMSKSFFQGATKQAAIQYLKPYRKVKVI